MRTLSVIAMAVLIACNATLASEQAGWNNTHWGMTVREVQQLYPGAKQSEQAKTHWAVLAVDEHKIGESKYHLNFFFDGNGQLREVGLYYVPDMLSLESVECDITASRLREKLTEKYGKPDMVEGGELARWHWSTKTLNIVLSHTQLLGRSMVNLSYVKPEEILGQL
jgi:hypothetical protein